MPRIAIRSADLDGPIGKKRLQIEICATMLYPRDELKRAALCNSLIMCAGRRKASSLGTGLLEAPSALALIEESLSVDDAVKEAWRPLVRLPRNKKIEKQSFLAGEIAGWVLRDFLAQEYVSVGSARLGNIFDNISNELVVGGAPLNSGPKAIKTAWTDYKTVSHFWAAFSQLSHEGINAPLFYPSTKANEYVLLSEAFRSQASTVVTKRSGCLLDDSSWSLPPEFLHAAWTALALGTEKIDPIRA